MWPDLTTPFVVACDPDSTRYQRCRNSKMKCSVYRFHSMRLSFLTTDGLSSPQLHLFLLNLLRPLASSTPRKVLVPALLMHVTFKSRKLLSSSIFARRVNPLDWNHSDSASGMLCAASVCSVQLVILHVPSGLMMLCAMTDVRRPLEARASGIGQSLQGGGSCAKGGGDQ